MRASRRQNQQNHGDSGLLATVLFLWLGQPDDECNHRPEQLPILDPTTMGHVFMLNRLTGAPLLPIEERRVPQSDIAGEESSPTQPFSTISLVPERFEADEAWGPKPDDIKWCREKIAASRNEGIFTPPSLRGTVQAPGNVGGVNWGSAAFDPQHHLMIVNTNRLIAWVKLIPLGEYAAEVHKDEDNRIYGEFGDQEPSPYGLYRTFLFSPSGTPCNRPPFPADLHLRYGAPA